MGRCANTRANAGHVTELWFDLRDNHFCQQRRTRSCRLPSRVELPLMP